MDSKIRKSMVLFSGIMAVMLSLVVSSSLSNDWEALYELDEIQLSKQINLLHEELKQNPSHHDAAKGLGIAYHILATKDAETYGPNAVKFLDMAFEENRKDYVTMCYLGSATTMMAKTTWNPVKKMFYVHKGTPLMDEAVKKDPDNISVRMTRALNSKRLPSFLGRGHLALEDFEHLATLIEKGAEFDSTTRKKVYANLAELYRKAGELKPQYHAVKFGLTHKGKFHILRGPKREFLSININRYRRGRARVLFRTR